MTPRILVLSALHGCVGDGARPPEAPIQPAIDVVPMCEGELRRGFEDRDGDGWGDALAPSIGCAGDRGLVERGGDCDDADERVHPYGYDSSCDGIDGDCDGVPDDEQPLAFADADADGFGDPSAPVTCASPSKNASSNDDDCDDRNPEAHPGGRDDDCNGIDEDCDGTPDDHPWGFADDDFDGFGGSVSTCWGGASAPTDCNDRNALVNPRAIEVCDGGDNDCDGQVDEGFHDDRDQDGLGGGPVVDCAWATDGPRWDDDPLVTAPPILSACPREVGVRGVGTSWTYSGADGTLDVHVAELRFDATGVDVTLDESWIEFGTSGSTWWATKERRVGLRCEAQEVALAWIEETAESGTSEPGRWLGRYTARAIDVDPPLRLMRTNEWRAVVEGGVDGSCSSTEGPCTPPRLAFSAPLTLRTSWNGTTSSISGSTRGMFPDAAVLLRDVGPTTRDAGAYALVAYRP